MSMPDYTLEQKAAVFDALWENYGNVKPTPRKWKAFALKPRAYAPGGKPTAEEVFRVPICGYEVLFAGELFNFKEVLHILATKKL